MTSEELLSLHRYYIWANRMREHFDQVIRRRGQTGLESILGDGTMDTEIMMYMSLWYGGLYVVVEGWQKLGLSDPEIDPLLSSPNTAKLRIYRHGTFHYQKNYWSETFLKFMRDGESTATWVRQLTKAFGRYFLVTMDERIEPSI
jgi:hypothetical protein